MALYLWTGEERYRERAEAILRGFAAAMSENVFAHAGLLVATLDSYAPALIVLIVPEGGDAKALRRGTCRRVAARRRGAGGEGRGAAPRVVTGARQDRDRGQAHGLCLHRPAMLSAGDGPRGAGRDRQDRTPKPLA